MANTKISQLSAISSITGSDVFPVVQGGTTYKIAFGDITGSITTVATASYALYAISASYEITQELSSSYAESASYASYVATASYVPTLQQVTDQGAVANNNIVLTGSFVNYNQSTGIIVQNSTSRGLQVLNQGYGNLGVSMLAEVNTVSGYFKPYGGVGSLTQYQAHISSLATDTDLILGAVVGTGAQIFLTSSADASVYLGYATSNSTTFVRRLLQVEGYASASKIETSNVSSSFVGHVLTLTPSDPLPSNVETGSFAVSASVPPIPYFWDGSTWNALY